jgi:hypothetical protein
MLTLSLRGLLLALLLALTLLFPAGLVSAADSTDSEALFREKGFLIGYGRGSLPEGGYETIFLMGHLGIDMAKAFPSLKRHRGLLTFILEPQVNPVVSPDNDLEFGLGVGFKYMYPVFEQVSVFANASTGPHYISVNTSKQSDGFCFANTVGGGLYVHLTKDTALSLGYRLRHLSNARTRAPNGGIDSHHALIGISFFY